MKQNNQEGTGIDSKLHNPIEDRLTPLEPLDLNRIRSIDGLVRAMAKTAFTGRQLGEATDVLEAMARDQDCFKVMTLAGAMTVAKQGLIIAELIDRGIVNAMFAVEAIRTAMAQYGNKPMTGDQVRWGFEHLNLTDKRLEELGMKGFTHPVKVSCEDHESSGPILVQQWDGKKWTVVSDWIQPMREVVRPKIEAAAVEEGKKLGYTMRDCSKEK